MHDALFQQSLLNYQNTVLQAQQEVQNSIVQYLQAKNGYYILAQTVRSARESTRLALVKYQSGETSYTSVLDAQKEQLGIESSLVETKASIDIALASLFRALGGGWQLRGDSDVISDEIREQMAARTNWGGLLKPANHLPQLVSKQSAIKKIRPIW
jgi:outer membrane protein TolC